MNELTESYGNHSLSGILVALVPPTVTLNERPSFNLHLGHIAARRCARHPVNRSVFELWGLPHAVYGHCLDASLW